VWGLESEILKRVIGGIKRSPAYRRIADRLRSRCPLDVWIEDGLGFVQFLVGDPEERELGWAVFAICLEDGQVIAAKTFTPNKHGQQIIVSEL
jgi:hypothetical protein